jgi:hypothetical protein
MAHQHWKSLVPWLCSEVRRLIAGAGKRAWGELTAEYGATLMEGLDG